MKSIIHCINEATRNTYDIYFSYSKKAVAITAPSVKDSQIDEEQTYETIDDAVKAIYNVDPICDIRIIPSQKFAEFMTK